MAGEVAQHPSPTSLQPPNGGNSASSQRRSSGHRLRNEVRAPARCAGISSLTWTGPGPMPMPMPMLMPTHARGQEDTSRCFGSERHTNHPPTSNSPQQRTFAPSLGAHRAMARGSNGVAPYETGRLPLRLTPGWETAKRSKRRLSHRICTRVGTPGQIGRLCVNVSSRRTEASGRQLYFIVPCPAHTINGLA